MVAAPAAPMAACDTAPNAAARECRASRPAPPWRRSPVAAGCRDCCRAQRRPASLGARPVAALASTPTLSRWLARRRGRGGVLSDRTTGCRQRGRQHIRRQPLRVRPPLTQLAHRRRFVGTQQQEVERGAKARMGHQAEHALALDLLEARLQRPDLLHGEGEPPWDRHPLALLAHHLVRGTHPRFVAVLAALDGALGLVAYLAPQQ